MIIPARKKASQRQFAAPRSMTRLSESHDIYIFVSWIVRRQSWMKLYIIPDSTVDDCMHE